MHVRLNPYVFRNLKVSIIRFDRYNIRVNVVRLYTCR
jgi:hypothetical protein